MTKLVVAAAFLGLNFYAYNFMGGEPVIPPRAMFSSFPLQLGEWKCEERERMEKKIEDRLGVTDYLICSYERDDPRAEVGIYVGYHESQVREGGKSSAESSIHPPKHCLPGAGWDIIDSRKVTLDLPGLPQSPARVNRFVIAKGEYRQLVYYWYQSRGRVIADDWRKIVDLFWDRATRYRSDGSLMRFTIPMHRGQEEQADADFKELASLLIPELPRYVPE